MRRLLGVTTTVLALAAAPLLSSAEPFMPDAVTQAIEHAGQEPCRGDARGDVLARLRDALLKAGPSGFRSYADALAADLETSIALENARTAEKSAPAASPEKYLMDSRWQPRVWRPEGGERSRWGEAFSRIPDDPAGRILREDRRVIDRLLPLLEDRSPTRGFVASEDAGSFAAIAKAREWWARGGRAQYSFDRIEALIAERARSASTK